MADEFRTIQEEALKVNREFHNIIQDALKVGVPKREILKILRKRKISYEKAKRLLDGKNIPFTAYEGGMKSRVEAAKKEAERRGEGETINKEYFYPKKLFREILREYKNKSIKIEEPGESELDKLRDYIKQKENEPQASVPLNKNIQTASIQTPPLPQTPMPNIQPIAQQINPQTNLTRTQQALLSPEEQLIASRRT
jgi:hypothetical protein